MSQKYYTKLTDLDQIKFIQECISNKNLSVRSATINCPIDRQYPFLLLIIKEDGDAEICQMKNPDKNESKLTPIKFKQLVRTHKLPPHIKLNNDYTAIITSSGVKVGCQLFPHSIILELAEVIKKLNK